MFRFPRNVSCLSSKGLFQSNRCLTTIAQKHRYDFDDLSLQLIEENATRGYKLYYERGMPDSQIQKEYNQFVDTIWFGRENEETVYKLIRFATDIQIGECDSFILRDYHNNKIIGCNSLKRGQAKLSTILNTSNTDEDDKIFNSVTRRITSMSKDYRGKGLGSVIRSYSAELEDNHINDCGGSLTDIQNKNIASLTLQLNSGMEIISKADIRMFYRHKTNLNDLISSKYDLYIVHADSGTDAEDFQELTGLYQKYIKQYDIIDFTVNSNEIYKPEPIFIIRDKHTKHILGAIQTQKNILQIKAASLIGKYTANVISKFMNGFNGQEQDFNVSFIFPMFFDYDNSDHDMVECVSALITFCLQNNQTNLGLTMIDSRNPFIKFMDEYDKSKQILGKIGSIMSEPESVNIVMKYKGLNDQQLNKIKSNPITAKLPAWMLF
eukprot:186863_1